MPPGHPEPQPHPSPAHEGPAGPVHPQEHGGGEHGRSIWQSIQTGYEDYVAPAFHVAHEMIPAVHHGADKIVPLLGTYLGIADAGLNIYQAATSEGSERWDHIGGAVLGALGAIPAVGSYTGAAELGWNVGVNGAASVQHGSVSEGMADVHHQGGNANQMVGKGLHALWDMPGQLWGGIQEGVGGIDRGIRGLYGAP